MPKFVPKGPPRYSHQRRGLNKIIETGGVCALLFEPGTGKTATTLDYCSVLALKMPPDTEGVKETRVLVIAPLVAVDTWVMQAETYVHDDVNYWAEVLGGSIKEKAEALAARGNNPIRATKGKNVRQRVAPRALHTRKSPSANLRSDREPQTSQSEGPDGLGTGKPRLIIEVVNIDTFASRQRVGGSTMADVVLDGVKRFSPDLVVIDESHKIKSASSNVSRLMARIQPLVKRRVLLTGTVMPAGPLDVFGQWRFMEPYAFGRPQPDGSYKKASFGEFKERYAQMGGFMGREVVGFKNLDEMQDIMAKNAIVARKEDALDLPATSDATVPIHFTAAERKVYQEMKTDLATKVESGEMAQAQNGLVQMMRLRQITSGHLPMDDGTVKSIGASKADAIVSLVHDTLAGEKRVVIFCLFSHEIQQLDRRLHRPGTHVDVITGSTPQKERMRIRERFGSDDPTRIVLVAQIKTLSLAVNELVTANHAIFGSMSQQRDDYIQARDRLNRIGQKRPVTFWNMVVEGTIDEAILQSHRDGTDLEQSVLRHILESDVSQYVVQ